jgi:UDP-N-acetylglucosamine 2-epimerase (non-hydrolysing)
VLARWHFAPTERAKAELLREGQPKGSIHVVGNTVIDALLSMAGREDLPWPSGLQPMTPGQRLILVTLHRRENFGEPLRRILGAIKAFALRHPEARIVYPVHPNPHVLGPAHEILGGLPGVDLIAPQDYPQLVCLMNKAYLVCTDSGGIQEEAPALGKPVLVFRDVTERPEAVEAGGVLLVGSDPGLFAREAERLWTDLDAYREMAIRRFPYGDGQASRGIATILAKDLSEPER